MINRLRLLGVDPGKGLKLDNFINRLVEWIGDFISKRPGLLPLIGLILIVVNLLIQIVPGPGNWLVDRNILLHVGLIVSLIGLLLIRPLS